MGKFKMEIAVVVACVVAGLLFFFSSGMKEAGQLMVLGIEPGAGQEFAATPKGAMVVNQPLLVKKVVPVTRPTTRPAIVKRVTTSQPTSRVAKRETAAEKLARFNSYLSRAAKEIRRCSERSMVILAEGERASSQGDTKRAEELLKEFDQIILRLNGLNAEGERLAEEAVKAVAEETNLIHEVTRQLQELGETLR